MDLRPVGGIGNGACPHTVCKGQYDIVVANILSNPLKALAPAICSHVRPGGKLALSGILSEQADELIAFYAPYVPLTVADSREGWVCLSGEKSAA